MSTGTPADLVQAFHDAIGVLGEGQWGIPSVGYLFIRSLAGTSTNGWDAR